MQYQPVDEVLRQAPQQHAADERCNPFDLGERSDPRGERREEGDHQRIDDEIAMIRIYEPHGTHIRAGESAPAAGRSIHTRGCRGYCMTEMSLCTQCHAFRVLRELFRQIPGVLGRRPAARYTTPRASVSTLMSVKVDSALRQLRLDLVVMMESLTMVPAVEWSPPASSARAAVMAKGAAAMHAVNISFFM